MTFDEWWNSRYKPMSTEEPYYEIAHAAWDEQQKRIDTLEAELRDMEKLSMQVVNKHDEDIAIAKATARAEALEEAAQEIIHIVGDRDTTLALAIRARKEKQ